MSLRGTVSKPMVSLPRVKKKETATVRSSSSAKKEKEIRNDATGSIKSVRFAKEIKAAKEDIHPSSRKRRTPRDLSSRETHQQEEDGETDKRRIMVPQIRSARIGSILWSLLSPEYISKISVMEITTPQLYARREPATGGILDLRKGPLSRSQLCLTCGGTSQQCPRHPAHIYLCSPVPHVLFLGILLKMLRAVCFFDSKLLVYKGHPKYDPRKACGPQQKRLAWLAKAGKEYAHCGVVSRQERKRVRYKPPPASSSASSVSLFSPAAASSTMMDTVATKETTAVSAPVVQRHEDDEEETPRAILAHEEEEEDDQGEKEDDEEEEKGEEGDEEEEEMEWKGCGGWQPHYKQQGLTIVATWDHLHPSIRPDPLDPAYHLTHQKMAQILDHITDETARAMGFDPQHSHPKWLMIKCLLIPPSSIHPPREFSEGDGSRGHDDLTTKLHNFVAAEFKERNCYHQLALAESKKTTPSSSTASTKKSTLYASPSLVLAGAPEEEQEEEHCRQETGHLDGDGEHDTSDGGGGEDDLKKKKRRSKASTLSWADKARLAANEKVFALAAYFDSKISEVSQSSDREAHTSAGLYQRLSGKDRRYRGNCTGRRTGQSGRAVIVPAPDISVGHVDLPDKISDTIGHTEFLARFNVHHLRRDMAITCGFAAPTSSSSSLSSSCYPHESLSTFYSRASIETPNRSLIKYIDVSRSPTDSKISESFSVPLSSTHETGTMDKSVVPPSMLHAEDADILPDDDEDKDKQPTRFSTTTLNSREKKQRNEEREEEEEQDKDEFMDTESDDDGEGIKTRKKRMERERVDVKHIGDGRRIRFYRRNRVVRALRNGDIVLVNRQPTLHRSSIMAHIIRRNTDRLRRLLPRPRHVIGIPTPVCTPYNADFDGDEMNIHGMAQEEAEAEARLSMAAHKHLISIRDGEAKVLPAMNSALGGWYLTDDRTRMTPFDAHQLLFQAYRGTCIGSGRDGREQDAIFEERILAKQEMLFGDAEWVTGKDVFSCLLPDRLWHTDEHLEIVNGRLVRGRIGKGALKTIVRLISKDMGSVAAAAFVTTAQRVFNYQLMQHGSTITLEDCMCPVPEALEALMERPVRMCERAGWSPHPAHETKTLELLKTLMSNAGSLIQNEINKRRANWPHYRNGMVDLVEAGVKGNPINLIQMLGMVGQQTLSGRRIVDSLFHYSPEERLYKLVALGWIGSSYSRGLRPQQHFPLGRVARHDLIALAVGVPDTGYGWRKMTTAAEDARHDYDLSTRTARGDIIQHLTGEDGFDGTQIERVPLQLLSKSCTTDTEFKQCFCWKPEDPEVAELDTHGRATVNKEESELYGHWKVLPPLLASLEEALPTTVPSPVPFSRIVSRLPSAGGETRPIGKGYEGEPLVPFVIALVDEFLVTVGEWGLLGVAEDQARPEIRHGSFLVAGIRDAFASKRVIREYRWTADTLIEALRLTETYIRGAILAPGSMIGTLSTQSIGEPATQMTLSQFRTTDDFARNLSFDRLSALINAKKTRKGRRASPDLSMLLYFDNPSITESEAKLLCVQLPCLVLDECVLEHHILAPSQLKSTATTTTTTLTYPSWITRSIHRSLVLMFQHVRIQAGKPRSTTTRRVAKMAAQEEEEEDDDKEEKEHDDDGYDDNDMDKEMEEDDNMQAVVFLLDRRKCERRGLVPSRLCENLSANAVWSSSDHIWMSSTPHDEQWWIMCGVNLHHEQYQKEQDKYIKKGYPSVSHEVILENISQYLLKDVTVLGMEGVLDAKLTKTRGGEYVIQTIGSNYIEAMRLPWVNKLSSTTNDIHGIAQVLGIHAVRYCLHKELQLVLKQDPKTTVGPRHTGLLSAIMCHQGKVFGCTRFELMKKTKSVLHGVSFEQSVECMTDAAIDAKLDAVAGVSDNLIAGQTVRMGARMANISFDEKWSSPADRQTQSRINRHNRAQYAFRTLVFSRQLDYDIEAASKALIAERSATGDRSEWQLVTTQDTPPLATSLKPTTPTSSERGTKTRSGSKQGPDTNSRRIPTPTVKTSAAAAAKADKTEKESKSTTRNESKPLSEPMVDGVWCPLDMSVATITKRLQGKVTLGEAALYHGRTVGSHDTSSGMTEAGALHSLSMDFGVGTLFYSSTTPAGASFTPCTGCGTPTFLGGSCLDCRRKDMHSSSRKTKSNF